MSFAFLRNLAAKSAIAFSVFLCIGVNSAHAGIPVVDGSNLAQNVMTALQTAQSYAQQLQQYQTQLQQYENEIKNTVAPAAYLWDQAKQTIGKITGIVNQVQALRDSNGGALTSYLNNFKDASFYSNSPCFKAAGCSGSTYNQMIQGTLSSTTTTKEANDALLRALDQQQNQLQGDAANLASLQSGATTAIGQMQAIQSANQLSSAMSNNLLQMRALMLAQMQAAAARQAADLDRQAQQDASKAYIRTTTYSASPVVSY
ncbi:P-type conjugative transfer protein TrbJ [Burkholderia gladioli]|uniref:P-type conjugative transfer protein TrbJ n=1 Tax=Burkholderia gladioli TaxID=28095 RepID=UPI00285DAF0A|nr:P-type conjugative transfer protein TrbJ [Burkholderia gladioli]MDR8093091.1 P-type conjugative transfer protein TrbJ [Burkholderia gladioli]